MSNASHNVTSFTAEYERALASNLVSINRSSTTQSTSASKLRPPQDITKTSSAADQDIYERAKERVIERIRGLVSSDGGVEYDDALAYPGFDTSRLYGSTGVQEAPPTQGMSGTHDRQYEMSSRFDMGGHTVGASPAVVEHVVKLVIEPGAGWIGDLPRGTQTQSLGLYPVEDKVTVTADIFKDSGASFTENVVPLTPQVTSSPQVVAEVPRMTAQPSIMTASPPATDESSFKHQVIEQSSPGVDKHDGVLKIGHNKGDEEFGRGKNDVVGCKTQ